MKMRNLSGTIMKNRVCVHNEEFIQAVAASPPYPMRKPAPMRRCVFSRSPSPEFDECGELPKRSPRVLLREKLTPVLRPGEWGVFNARLTEALVRRTVREYRFTRLTPALLIALLREKLRKAD